MIDNNKPPTSFRVIAIAALIWNALGVMAFIMDVTMSAETLAELSEGEQALYAMRPAWALAAFGIAVFGGLAASIALALRKRAATMLFAVSLAAVVVQTFWAYVLADSFAVTGPPIAAFQATILVIGAALLWYSRRATAGGWLS